MIFTSRDAAKIIVPWRVDLATLIPHAKVLDYQGQKHLVIPNDHEEARLARNLGVPVPSPILTRYDWNGDTPWEAQRHTAALLVESPRCYVLSTMGAGKTRAVLYAADYLKRIQRARKVLIIAPLSTLTPVWEAEIFRVFPHRSKRVLHGDRGKRLKALADEVDFYIINHHGVAHYTEELQRRQFDIVVVDELATFRTKGTDLWKGLNAIVNRTDGKIPAPSWVWGMTGSPTPNAPTDAWAQIKLLTPQRTTRTMAGFQDQTMRRVSQFKWLPKPDANETVHAQMQPSVRYTIDQIKELPPTVYVDRDVQLSNEAKTAYKTMFNKLRLSTNAGKSITAMNEGVLQNKLMQIACGYIYTDDHNIHALPNDGRLSALKETLDETERKAIVFVPYVHALKGVSDYLRGKGYDVAMVHGETPTGQRNKIFTSFQSQPSPRVIVAHPQCMAHGLTLTEANLIVWYAPTQSLEIYEQANARIVRPGQTHKTIIAHLRGTAVERLAYARLRSRAKMQGLLLALFRDQEVEF